MEQWKKTFTHAVEAQKDLGIYINRTVHEERNPLKVLELFKRISDEVRESPYAAYLFDSFLTGLRTSWAQTGVRSPGGVPLAIYLRSSSLYPAFRCPGRSIE